MNHYIHYDLYGKPSKGTEVQLNLQKKIQNEMITFMQMSPTPIILDDYFRMDEDYYIGFFTFNLMGYSETIESVARFSKKYPCFVFKLEVFDEDDLIHARIYFQNGEIEHMKGHIEYEEAKKIGIE